MVAGGHAGAVAQRLVDLEGAQVLPPRLLVVPLPLGQHAQSMSKHRSPVGVIGDPGEGLPAEPPCPTVGSPGVELVACPVSDSEGLVEFTSGMVVIAGF